jgi:nitroimidazol reductase NimA-like FMN-containing flavoprotein (pyridoxamine 5'-phosphate oxidase superfamily)
VIDLETTECLRVLDEGYVAHIGVISGGLPYVTPMSYVFIDDTVFFRTGPGRRADALREEPLCCVEVTILREDDAWESVLFWGEARFVDDPNERSNVVAALLHKYHTEAPLGSSSPSFLPTEHPIIAIEPSELTGRASGRALGRQTRPGRL